MKNPAESLQNKYLINLLIKDKYRLFRHVMMLLSFSMIFFNAKLVPEYSGYVEYYSLLTAFFFFVLFFYTNMYVLVPYFFFKARYALYLLLLITMVSVGFLIIARISDTYFEPYRIVQRTIKISDLRAIISLTIFLSPFILVTTTLKLLQRWIKDNERITELKNLTISMELEGLKNQINPHFLFNMLNNVNALIKTDQEKAYNVVLKLSEFLRYQLYENNEEKTLLQSEINFLTNLLDLETMRRDFFSYNIDVNINQKTINHIVLPPNLFTVFIENAVKHSADVFTESTYINVFIEIKDQKLHFRCSNSKSPEDHYTDSKSGGLGLSNITRRLELLYDKNYDLDIKMTEQDYTINLSIPI